MLRSIDYLPILCAKIDTIEGGLTSMPKYRKNFAYIIARGRHQRQGENYLMELHEHYLL